MSDDNKSNDETIKSTLIADDAFDDVLFSGDAEPESVNPEETTDAKQNTVSPEINEGFKGELFFADDVEVSDQRLSEVAQQKPLQDDQPAESLASDALFTSSEELEAVTDLPGLASISDDDPADEPEYEDALFSSNEDLEAATDAAFAASRKVAVEEPSDNDEPAVRDAIDSSEDRSQRESFTASNNDNVEAQIGVLALGDILPKTLLDRGDLDAADLPLKPYQGKINGVGALDLFDEKAVDEGALMAHEQREAAKKLEQEEKNKVVADKNVADKAKRFLFKAKENVGSAVGGDLPERELDLAFKFIAQKSKKDVEGLLNKRELTQQLEKKGATVHILMKKVEQQLLLLTKTEHSTTDRLRLLETSDTFLIPAALSLVKRFARRPLQAADGEYNLTALSCAEAIKHSITGYRQIFSHLYEANNFNYKRHQQELQGVAYQLVQLLLLEQRFLAVIQQALPSLSLKTMNKLFTAMHRYENDFSHKEQSSAVFSVPMTLHKCFVHYHLLAMFDYCQLSPRLLPCLIAYLIEHADLVELLDAENIVISSSSQLLEVNHADGVAGRYCVNAESELKTSVDCVYLSSMYLFNRIKNDFKQCFKLISKEQAKHSDTELKALSVSECLQLCAFMNKSIAQLEQDARMPSFNLYHAKKLQLLSQFAACGQAMTELNTLSPRGERGRLAEPRNLWAEAFCDDSVIYLQTQLSNKTVYLDIGTLVLINEELDEGSVAKLCVINRLERIVNNMINIMLKPLATHSAALEQGSLVGRGIESKGGTNDSHSESESTVQPLLFIPKRDVTSRQAEIISLGEEKTMLELTELYFVGDEFQIVAVR